MLGVDVGEDVVAERHEELRAADADRAKVADRLRVALEEGRLNLTEYDERLQQAYAAKTYGDLDPILADLPGPAAASRSQVVPSTSAGPVPAAADSTQASSDAAPGHPSVPRWLIWVWGTWLSAVLVNVAIWAAVSIGSDHAVYFWPIWVAGPWGALLLAKTISGLAGGDHKRLQAPWAQSGGRRADRSAARAERYTARDDRRQARRARYR
jgi:hypothetical protein